MGGQLAGLPPSARGETRVSYGLSASANGGVGDGVWLWEERGGGQWGRAEG